MNTFGQTEVTDNTMVVPYTVARYFKDTPTVGQIYFSVADASIVAPATAQIKRVIQSRHRAESVYNVTNLTQLVAVADKTANALTMVLLAVAAIVLLVSGIGIMNIMLATVSARIREIGIRKALGATQREILVQFLSEAVFISVGGGLIGVVIGLAIPYSGTLPHRISHPYFRIVCNRSYRGLVSGGNPLRHRPRSARRQAGSGGELALRVRQDTTDVSVPSFTKSSKVVQPRPNESFSPDWNLRPPHKPHR